ncbi:hypothetical protein SDC9_157859 [bioreactor metagenome]|uniref:Uncharacterized protein n=1 Tax=bioreactor metagenome TaxID=1076179 RepID=A0A645FDJ1_9ZZZZ
MCNSACLPGRCHQTQVFAYPRDDGTRIVDHAVEQVTDAPIDLPRDGGEHAMCGHDRFSTQIHHHAAAGTIPGHAHALLKAALAEQAGMGIPHGTPDRDGSFKQAIHIGESEHCIRITYLGKHRFRDPQQGADPVIPCTGVDVHQHHA